jgi:transcriptional regulator with XRE-family HTH domain
VSKKEKQRLNVKQRYAGKIAQVGMRIKLIREKKNIDQKVLALKANISVNSLSRIENGALNTGIATLCALAEALEVNEKQFFG